MPSYFQYIYQLLRKATNTQQVWYAPILTFAMALMMLRLLVMAKILKVEEFAHFNTGLLVSGTFCMLGCLGIQLLLQRNWPINITHKKEISPSVLAIQAYLVALVQLFIGVAFVFINPLSLIENTSIVLVGLLHGLSQQSFVIATVESRSRGNLLRYSLQNLYRGMLTVFFGVSVALITNSALLALLIEAMLTILLSVSFILHSLELAKIGILSLVNLAVRRMSKISWATAIILMFNGIVSFCILSGDRWVASVVLDLPNFALYSFAFIVILFSSSVQVLINASAFPTIAKVYAEHGIEKAYSFSFKLSVRIATISLILSVIFYCLLWFLIPKFFPIYTESRKLVLIFLLVSIFRISDFFSSFLIICNYGKNLLAINIIALGIAAMIYFCLIAYLGIKAISINVIAYVTLLTTLIFYLLVISQSWKKRNSATA